MSQIYRLESATSQSLWHQPISPLQHTATHCITLQHTAALTLENLSNFSNIQTRECDFTIAVVWVSQIIDSLAILSVDLNFSNTQTRECNVTISVASADFSTATHVATRCNTLQRWLSQIPHISNEQTRECDFTIAVVSAEASFSFEEVRARIREGKKKLSQEEMDKAAQRKVRQCARDARLVPAVFVFF